MKINKRGFTLKEQLVVVLIIGILAAIALPQYRKAVIRSKLTQLSTIMDTAKKDMDMYVLSNGDNGEIISRPGLRGELSLELMGDCSDEGEGWCKHDIGGYRVATNHVEFNGNGGTGFAFHFVMKKHGMSTPLGITEFDAEDALSFEVFCSWAKDNSYKAYEVEPYKICMDKGGVTLQTDF